MITHEQAKYIILNASAEFIEECSDADGKGTYICDYVHFRNSYVYDKIKPYFDKLETYITQQEKKDELLALYKELNNKNCRIVVEKRPFYKTVLSDRIDFLDKRIDELETELEEGANND